MKAIMFGSLLGLVLTVKAEEMLIRPSVWGQDKWYGGYELYSGDKKIGAVRPSVWGTEKWPGDTTSLQENEKRGGQGIRMGSDEMVWRI